jgi:hypothetical protein
LIVVCVSLTAYVFFTVTTAILVVIVPTVTVTVAIIVVCCCPQWHPHTMTIVNLEASFPLPHGNNIIQQCAKGIDGHQREAMCSNWSNMNTAINGEREWLAEEPQAP